MDRAMWGYTIIEVMIVLAITTLMFFAAVTVFSSQRGPTDFSQSMQDLNSAIQEYANRVVTSDYPGSGSYSCSASSGRAVLSQPGGSGTTCLFLGLAIQALPGQGALQIYTVLGNKDIWSGSDTGNPSTTIDNARPEPAMLGGSYVLNDTYTLGASATVVSAKDYNLLGMYNGLPGDNVASDQGTNALVLVGYNCGNAGCIKTCIEESGVCANPPRISQWTLCLHDASNRMAQLIVNGAPGGITTQLNFASCT